MEFFTTSIDQKENRKLALRISEQIVEAIRPSEVVFTDDVFDLLLDMALHAEVAQVGDVRFGFGNAELLMMVVVPVVTSALTAAFVSVHVAGIRGLKQPPEIQSILNQVQIEQIIRQSKLRLSRTEQKQLIYLLSQLLSQEFSEAAKAGALSSDRCCGYNCEEVRERIANAFSLNELRDLCFALREPYEDSILEGVPLASNTRNLIEYFLRRGRICDLISAVKQRREHIAWDDHTTPIE
jgi:hypothetical protein